VYVAEIEGLIAGGAADRIARAIDRAEDGEGQALILQLDTPGGLSTAMKDIIRDVEGAKIPVIVYVSPQGAYAFSAGTFILLSAHLAVMAPATSIGACQPRVVDPTTGLAEKASDKEINAFATYIASIALRHGRNETAARLFVTDNLALNPDEAVANGTVELVADDLDDLMALADGMSIRGAVDGAENITLTLQGARLVRIEWGIRDRVINYLTDPQIASLLLTIGMLGLLFGFLTPGFHVPETIGAISLILGLYGLSFIGVNAAGVILVVVALILFAVEVYTPTFGLWTTAGVIALLFGIVLIPASDAIYAMPTDWFTSFRIASLVVAVALGAFFAYAMAASLKAKRTQPRLGDEEFVGQDGIAVTAVDPQGQVKVRGKIWQAQTHGEPIRPGEPVTVLEKKRLLLTVEKKR
jgi:membrane-bound serine protease (ClpP class)